MEGSPEWQRQAELVVSTLRSLLSEAELGIYVHGSAALGGWTPASDLDVLVTTGDDHADWRTVGHGVLAALTPAPVVELSIVSARAAAAARRPWPFLVHVDQRESRIVTDDGAGDADLLMHYLVARHRGITLAGPPAEASIGRVPRAAVLAYLKDELRWARESADQKYALLNACRALAYSEDRLVLSKIAGAEWALARGHDRDLIEPALDAQRTGTDLGPPNSAARAFITECVARLENSRT